MSHTAAATAAPSATAAAAGAASVSTTSAAAPSRSRGARIALRSLQVLLALFFGVASGLPKVFAHPTAVESFERLGWGDAGMYTIGALEVLGGIALLIPVLSSVAATAFIGLMIGASIVTVTALGGENAATPLVLILPLAWIAWARRGQTAELVRLVRRRV